MQVSEAREAAQPSLTTGAGPVFMRVWGRSSKVFDGCQSVGWCLRRLTIYFRSVSVWLAAGSQATLIARPDDRSYLRGTEPLGMSESPHMTAGVEHHDQPLYTWQEIVQQPLLWPTTVARVRAASERINLAGRVLPTRVLLTGAGSSAYAASSVALAWPRAVAVPTTDLLVDPERYLLDVGAVVSLARSGNSPESAAVVERVRALRPEVFQLAITCNDENLLAQSGLDGLIVLDPRTNDRSLVMTGSFSNLVLAGSPWLSPRQRRIKPMWRVSVRRRCWPPSISSASASPPVSATVLWCSVPRPCLAGAARLA